MTVISARQPLLLVLLLLLAALASVQWSTALDMSAVESDAEGVEELRNAIAAGWTPSRKDAKAVLQHAMSQGWWELSHKLVEYSRSLKVDLTASVYQSAASIRGRLKSLEEALRGAKSMSRFISPAFQWAQSPDSVFLNVKFSHKWDTPATLGCEADKVDFAARSLRFATVCASKRKNFALNLDLLRDIDAENCTWTMSSVGRAMLTMKKAVNGTWPRLLKARAKRPGNMHVWWSMKEKYEKENTEFDKQEAARRKEAEKNGTAASASKPAGSVTSSDGDSSSSSSDSTAPPANTKADTNKAADSPTPAPPAAVAAEPPASEYDMAKAELEKKYRKLRKVIDEELQSKTSEIANKARSAKLKAMADAKARKEEISAEAAEARATAEAEAKGKRDSLAAQLEAELVVKRRELGVAEDASGTAKEEL